MELAIMGAVGLLGYAVSERQPRVSDKASQPPPTNPHRYPFGPGTEVQAMLDADRRATQARWEQAQQPHLTGVVTPNTKPGDRVPFFTSARKQHTNTAVKQRRVELYTGALDAGRSETGTLARKREVANLFKPEWTATAVTSSGTSGSTPIGVDMASRYVPSLRQNNVVPTQQVRVGPGLGVGTEVAAADGFHPMLRIMPRNVNEHRLNNLPGGFVPGAAPIAARPSEVTLAQQGPPRYWEQERRPTMPMRAAIDAATNRPEVVVGACGGRLVGDHYFGGASQGGTYVSQSTSRDRDDNHARSHDTDLTNVTAARHGVGAFVRANHDTSRVDSQQREQFQAYDGVLTGPAAPRSDALHLLPQTNRSLHTAEVMGNPGTAVSAGQTRPQDRPGTTLRELTHGPTQPGVATPYIRGHTVQGAGKYLVRESKRHGQHVVNWLPPAHKPTNVRAQGLVQVKPRLQVTGTYALPTTPTPIAMAPLGQLTTPHNKLPSTNVRLDPSLVSVQLSTNELHRPLNG